MIRVGLGYDIHRLREGRRLILGGVEIPFNRGLDGHSDADVVSHALMDGLLGAAGLDDIGHHFPPSDPAYRGVSSLHLLSRVQAKVTAAGYAIGNVDVMIVAEEPRLGSYLPDMRRQLATTLQVHRDRIGIKATTNEGLGAEGRGEGISAQAVVLLERVT